MRHAACCIYDDFLFRYRFKKVGFQYYIYRCFMHNQSSSPRIRALCKQKIVSTTSGIYFTRQKRRCRITGNSSFVLKHIGLHRLFAKFYLGLGFFKGYRRVGY